MLWDLTSGEQKPPSNLELKLHGEAIGSNNSKRIWVPRPLIIGAGPSGLAIAACLKEKGVPSLILEKENCIASSWRMKTYERLKLHLPKHFCELPLMPFPPNFPVYPTKQQFISYLDSYINHFSIRPLFGMEVRKAEYDNNIAFWRINAGDDWEFICRWLIVATGENAETMVPKITGMSEFKGRLLHTNCYKKGDDFRGERVLVVGCGNSGMEVCLDLCNNHAEASMVVRDKLHILPREVLGVSTFGLSVWLLRWLPVRVADCLLLLCARLILGETEKHGLKRPKIGPLELKNSTGKTPVLDIGALSKIKSGHIKVVPGINRFLDKGVEFVDGRQEEFDSIILATGYRSNVTSWLKVLAAPELVDSPEALSGSEGLAGLEAEGSEPSSLSLESDADKLAAAPKQKIRIKLRSYWVPLIEDSCKQILEAARSTNAKTMGPVPLPTKKRVYCVLKSPHVHKDARFHFEIRTHHRLIDILYPTAQTIDSLMQLDLPAGVDVEVKL